MRDVTPAERARIIAHMENAKAALAARKSDTLLDVARTLAQAEDHMALARAEQIQILRAVRAEIAESEAA